MDERSAYPGTLPLKLLIRSSTEEYGSIYCREFIILPQYALLYALLTDILIVLTCKIGTVLSISFIRLTGPQT